MSTSATETHFLRRTLVFLGASLFCGIVTLVYNRFGHGVHSANMDLLFLLPLFGALPNLIAFVAKLKPSVLSGLLISCGTATLTVWSLLRGIVEIAGTDSPYIVLFLAAGALLYVAGLVIFTATAVRKK